MKLDTYLCYWWYSDWTSNIFFLAFLNTFFMLFRTGDQIHPHLEQPKMNLIPLCMVELELVLSWKLCLLWIYKVIFIIELLFEDSWGFVYSNLLYSNRFSVYQKVIFIIVLYVKIIQVIFIRKFYILTSLYLLESYIYHKLYLQTSQYTFKLVWINL